MDAPDIDTRVYFTGAAALSPGDFAPVRVTGSDGYDLVGEQTESANKKSSPKMKNLSQGM
jgi:ribosomal protein S12 methylthiotransferase